MRFINKGLRLPWIWVSTRGPGVNHPGYQGAIDNSHLTGKKFSKDAYQGATVGTGSQWPQALTCGHFSLASLNDSRGETSARRLKGRNAHLHNTGVQFTAHEIQSSPCWVCHLLPPLCSLQPPRSPLLLALSPTYTLLIMQRVIRRSRERLIPLHPPSALPLVLNLN